MRRSFYREITNAKDGDQKGRISRYHEIEEVRTNNKKLSAIPQLRYRECYRDNTEKVCKKINPASFL